MHFVIINTSSVNVQLVDFVWSSFRRGVGGIVENMDYY